MAATGILSQLNYSERGKPFFYSLSLADQGVDAPSCCSAASTEHVHTGKVLGIMVSFIQHHPIDKVVTSFEPPADQNMADWVTVADAVSGRH